MGIRIRMNLSSRVMMPLVTGFLLFFIFSTFSTAQEALKQMRSNVIEKIDGKDYYIHTIKKGQTLYMISKAYGADVNDVIRENPDVKEGIRAEQKIRIPVFRTEELPKKIVKPVVPKPKEMVEPAPHVEPAPQLEPPPQLELPCGFDSLAKRDIYNVALMIPLYLNEIDQMNVETPPADAEALYNSLRFIQFYEGFRIALDSLQKSGKRFNVYIYDAVKDTNATRRLLRNPDMKKMDLILGLQYHRNFQMIASFALKNNIPIVNPISERDQIITGNPWVFKVRPSLLSQVPELTDYLSKSYRDDNIIIVRDIQFSEEEPENLRKACSDKSLNVHLVQGYGHAVEVLSKEKENILIVFSNNKVFTLELFTKLNEFRNEYQLTIFGMPKWDEMEGLEPEYLVNLKTHMMAPSFIDYDEREVRKFVLQFQNKYKTDPDPLAFQGFDIGCYFFSALEKYGKAFYHCIPELRMKSLQTDFQFTQSKGNGYENQHWEIYKFENYKVQKVISNN
jgi:LysM repeat protein/ABC-type branched-subunit amino acid transport system substrate-binding protein